MTPDEVALQRARSDAAFVDVCDERTWVTARMALIGVLWRHQGGVCGICGKTLPSFSKMKGANRLSCDHVFPKDRRKTSGRKFFHLNEKALRRKGKNYVCAHGKCNSDKGNRPPTGCELIWLQAVNARRGYDPLPWKKRR